MVAAGLEDVPGLSQGGALCAVVSAPALIGQGVGESCGPGSNGAGATVYTADGATAWDGASNCRPLGGG